MRHAFGPEWRAKPFTKCVHCGHNPQRWLTVVRHTPTGEIVVFGADCTKRMEFIDQKTFKLAQLQARDEAKKVRIKVWNQRERFLADHPVFAAAIETLDRPEHAKNWFAKDVVAKLGQYGSLSDTQVKAVLESLDRDRQYAARPVEVKGDAPSGRQTVTGLVLSVKGHESDFGFSQKMTVKLENGSRVWVTVPE